MDSVNVVFDRIKADQSWGRKVVMGILLMFIPIVNFFAMGYLMRYAERVVKNGDVTLPEWENWGRLFIGGLFFFLVVILYGILPLMVGWLLGILLSALTGGIMGWVPFFPLSILALIVPTLMVVGIFALRLGEGVQSLFWDIGRYWDKVKGCWDRLLIPNLAFLGLMIVGAPVYGLSIFLGFLLLIPYTAYVFIENKEIQQ